jgi:hypothetical protein
MPQQKTLTDELEQIMTMKERGLLSEEEFTQAKAQLLPGKNTIGQSHLVEVETQVARLDREWLLEREKYLIVTKGGAKLEPDLEGIRAAQAVLLIFGILFTSVPTVGFIAITNDVMMQMTVPKIVIFSPLIFILIGICIIVYSFKYPIDMQEKVTKYQEAKTNYEIKRNNLLGKLESESRTRDR